MITLFADITVGFWEYALLGLVSILAVVLAVGFIGHAVRTLKEIDDARNWTFQDQPDLEEHEHHEQ
jgi:hypothetical protein